MNYAELSAEVISEFTGEDLNKSEILEIAYKAYSNFLGDDADRTHGEFADAFFSKIICKF